jgi:hypothetical protein
LASSRNAGGASTNYARECWQRHGCCTLSIFLNFIWFVNRIKQYQDATNWFSLKIINLEK